MAELAVKVGDQGGGHSTRYRDGDVLCAFSNRRIRCTHAQHICHVRAAGFTNDGLRPNDSLAEKMLQRTRQYKIERTGVQTVVVTNLITMDEHTLSNVPDGDGRCMHVPEFVDNRLEHDRHAIFGSPGSEVWYGGRTYYENDRMTLVWNDIETHSAFREVDHMLWPAGRQDLKEHLMLPVNDMTDAEAEELVIPELKTDANGKPLWEKMELQVVVDTYVGDDHPEDDDGPTRWKRQITKLRQKEVRWPALFPMDVPPVTLPVHVTDVGRTVDVRGRGTGPFQRSAIVRDKT